ncbi:hypothetical protein EVAR_77366_1 [Eumeta japonica]|uniref:Uncharacterized protein n=1 Tax=Eumeta variegata TaxID=151549 RepID=A0A4C1UX48_EUMVA|nr:hypothetical protein EVAR_77366_1 [Eumeta japonica]
MFDNGFNPRLHPRGCKLSIFTSSTDHAVYHDCDPGLALDLDFSTAQSTHADDRRPSDADERRPRRGSTHRRSSSSSRSSTCQRAAALFFFFFFWPSSEWSIRSARGPPKHRFTIRVTVPTMSRQAPRRLQHGRRVTRRTLQRPVSAGGGRTSALCTSKLAAVPSRLHFSKLKCGEIGFDAMIARSAAHGARVRQHTRTQDGLRWPPWASGASSTACAGGVCGNCTRSRGRRDDPGELASGPATPRRGVRCGPLPGVNCHDVTTDHVHWRRCESSATCCGCRCGYEPMARTRASSQGGHCPLGSFVY